MVETNRFALTRARWLYLAGLAYLLVGYLATNEIAATNPWGRPALPIATNFDKLVPFAPTMVIFYVFYYPLLVMPLILSTSAASIRRLALAQFAINTTAYVVFLLFPTPIDRPPAVPVEGIFHTILDSLFRADHPFNTFPSLHVAQSCIVALFFLRGVDRPVYRHIVLHALAALLIAASAVMIKQHYLADAMAGALMAGVASAVFFRRTAP